jgi:hypothetical protein
LGDLSPEVVPVKTHPPLTPLLSSERVCLHVRKQSIQLCSGYFVGTLDNNAANRAKQGAGFNPLSQVSFREQNLFRNDAVGLNFEHIMNGAAKDADKRK